jgi:A/G-specific adenine glycosylase
MDRIANQQFSIRNWQMTASLATRLLNWYARSARRMPWRGHPDPYAVWVSEIMLQQTRVETVIPYFERWMERFPTLEALAAASQQEVLAAWEGLGYYSRARNLHRAAQIVIEEHGGNLPSEVESLLRLPGVGRYTAAAIASIAFGKDEATLDGNIRRVLARVFDLRQPARSTAGERRLWELAAAHLPPGQAGEYNQALMDLGASICTPRDPDCPHCPLAEICAALALGVQEERPVADPKPVTPHYTVTAAIIQRNGHVLIAQRPAEGLLGGLWEFPGGKLEPGEDLVGCLQREIREELRVEIGVRGALGVYRHAYTHFRVTLHAFHCTLEKGEPQITVHSDLRWAAPADLPAYPMGKIDRRIASQLTAAGG